MPFHRKEKEDPSRNKTVEQIEIERRMAERETSRREAEAAPQRESKPVKRKKTRKKRSPLINLLFWCLGIVAIILLAYAFSVTFCQAVTIQEGAMEPTISSGDTCLIDSASYRFHEPRRGDLIVYRSSRESDETLHVKRVIGLPGETIQITDGTILIDGNPYTESGNFPKIIDAGLASDPVTLGDNEYFVLGDNRNGSEDSRYASVGNIQGTDIVGRIWLRILPLDKFGTIS